MKLTMMTFNIHHGRGTDGELNLARIANIITKSGADLIGLNEVDRHFSARSDYKDQIRWLAERLQFDYAYGPALSLRRGASSNRKQYGNALLSRYPITSVENHRFQFRVVEDRALLEATVHVAKRRLKVYVTHLSLDPITHHRQTETIVNKVTQDDPPVIVLGDWNMRPGARAWKKITQSLQDVWLCAGVGPGYTFPSSRPQTRLDYIFLSDDFRITETKVVSASPEASDHLPVLATVHIPPDPIP